MHYCSVVAQGQCSPFSTLLFFCHCCVSLVALWHWVYSSGSPGAAPYKGSLVAPPSCFSPISKPLPAGWERMGCQNQTVLILLPVLTQTVMHRIVTDEEGGAWETGKQGGVSGSKIHREMTVPAHRAAPVVTMDTVF
jgi:hypothetical protein